MAKLAFTLFFLFTCSISIAGENKCGNEQLSESYIEQTARRGCCSHHGGVCGWEGGRTVCCDGSYSPSCGCHANDVKSFIENNQSEVPYT